MESDFDIDTMKAVSPDQLVPQLDELLELVQLQPLALEVEGERKAVLVTPSFYERAIEALEDLRDAEIIANLKPEDLAPTRPLHEFMEELGIHDWDKEDS